VAACTATRSSRNSHHAPPPITTSAPATLSSRAQPRDLFFSGTTRVGTAALGCPAEQSSALASQRHRPCIATYPHPAPCQLRSGCSRSGRQRSRRTPRLPAPPPARQGILTTPARPTTTSAPATLSSQAQPRDPLFFVTTHVGTAALGCPAEQSSAYARAARDAQRISPNRL